MKDILKKIKDIYQHQYTRCSFASLLYILWVIWLGNYWFLLGLPIVFDIYISKKVNWSPWKKREGKNHFLIEWFDAIIFAVFAVAIINIFIFQNYKIPTPSMEKTMMIGDHLYVSKVAFGPKIPNTPLSFPFAQHTMPFTVSTPSYLEWIQWPYKRLAGFRSVERNDIVVFNFPEGDTVVIEDQTASYYTYIRMFANQLEQRDIQNGLELKTKNEYYFLSRDYVWKQYTIKVRPFDRMDPYVKRCIAVGGDTLSVKDGYVHINGVKENRRGTLQFDYSIETDGTPMNKKVLKKLDVSINSSEFMNNGVFYQFPITEDNFEKIVSSGNIKAWHRNNKPAGEFNNSIFPHNEKYQWNEYQYGPLYIPKKGATVKLNMDNICIYQRLIDVYEYNKLEIKDSSIYINDTLATEYTFKQNYYFMMGDNRDHSADSRYWGFVPEEFVIGRPVFIWLSLDSDGTFPFNIRFKRMFSMIK